MTGTSRRRDPKFSLFWNGFTRKLVELDLSQYDFMAQTIGVSQRGPFDFGRYVEGLLLLEHNGSLALFVCTGSCLRSYRTFTRCLSSISFEEDVPLIASDVASYLFDQIQPDMSLSEETWNLIWIG
ncbi:hypothetical protein Tco_0034129 [Tanacetum coccineum]